VPVFGPGFGVGKKVSRCWRKSRHKERTVGRLITKALGDDSRRQPFQEVGTQGFILPLGRSQGLAEVVGFRALLGLVCFTHSLRID